MHENEDSDSELEEMYKSFGLPSNKIKTMTTKHGSEQSHCKERNSYVESIKTMETNLHCAEESKVQFMVENRKEEDIKIVRLEDATEMDVEEMGASLFLKYTENENEPEEEDYYSQSDALKGAHHNGTSNHNDNNDDEEHENYYSCDSDSEEDRDQDEEGTYIRFSSRFVFNY